MANTLYGRGREGAILEWHLSAAAVAAAAVRDGRHEIIFFSFPFLLVFIPFHSSPVHSIPR
jgi:hypothetical protein